MAEEPKRSNLVDLNPDGSPTKETLKRAMKAFRKRLKITRLDQVSTAGRNPLSSGAKSSILAVTPPEQYPALVWEALVAAGKLKSAGHGLYELVEQAASG